ncbi:MAG: hypothetical protein ACK559_27585, partial [bacterium]
AKQQHSAFALARVWIDALGHERTNASRADDMRMATILRRHGYAKRREVRADGRREVLWWR